MADLTTLESNLETARAELKAIIDDQLAKYPPEDPTSWSALTTDEKVAEYDRKNQAEAKVESARKALSAEHSRRAAFFDSRKQANKEFDAIWQIKENNDFDAAYEPTQAEIDAMLT